MTTPEQKPAAGTRMRRPRIERAWIIIGVVLLGAVAMGLLGAFMAPERQSDMWVELVKSSIQVVVLAIAGGVANRADRSLHGRSRLPLVRRLQQY